MEWKDKNYDQEHWKTHKIEWEAGDKTITHKNINSFLWEAGLLHSMSVLTTYSVPSTKFWEYVNKLKALLSSKRHTIIRKETKEIENMMLWRKWRRPKGYRQRCDVRYGGTWQGLCWVIFEQRPKGRKEASLKTSEQRAATTSSLPFCPNTLFGTVASGQSQKQLLSLPQKPKLEGRR